MSDALFGGGAATTRMIYATMLTAYSHDAKNAIRGHKMPLNYQPGPRNTKCCHAEVFNFIIFAIFIMLAQFPPQETLRIVFSCDSIVRGCDITCRLTPQITLNSFLMATLHQNPHPVGLWIFSMAR